MPDINAQHPASLIASDINRQISALRSTGTGVTPIVEFPMFPGARYAIITVEAVTASLLKFTCSDADNNSAVFYIQALGLNMLLSYGRFPVRLPSLGFSE